MSQIKEVMLILVGFLLSIVGALIGAFFQRYIDRRTERRPLNSLMNFGDDDLLFIFPHREEITEAILPRTSTEDFMAMNNFISVLIKMGWTHGSGVRDTDRIQHHDRNRNLVIICSPKSNHFAEVFQRELKKRYDRVYFFTRTSKGQWDIFNQSDADRPAYVSPSWEQEAEYMNAGFSRQELPSKSFRDYAVITKVANPWNPSNKVLWIAGIRGIGTWGAAECIKKRWRDIYDKLPENAKCASFSALIKVQYDNCDITSTEIQDVVVLKDK